LWRWRFFFNPEKAKVKKEMDAKLAGAATGAATGAAK